MKVQIEVRLKEAASMDGSYRLRMKQIIAFALFWETFASIIRESFL